MTLNGFAGRSEPDFNRFLKVLTRTGLPDRVPFAELYVDQAAIASLLDEKPIAVCKKDGNQTQMSWLQQIRFFSRYGMDFVPITVDDALWERLRRKIVLQATDGSGRRSWLSEGKGPVATADDIARMNWPRNQDLDFSDLEFISTHMPAGMKILAGTNGPFQLLLELMGFEVFSLALHEDPQLIDSVLERVGDFILWANRQIAACDSVGALMLGDDMCYRAGPMFPPEFLRRKVFPLHRRIAEIAHGNAKPLIFHSDGDNRLLMDDLIRNVGIDAKHAFEDSCQTVEEAKTRYGKDISLIGGVDMNLLCSPDESAIRKRVRELVEFCKVGGGFAVGSGNSLASYIPRQNYLLMLSTALEAGSY